MSDLGRQAGRQAEMTSQPSVVTGILAFIGERREALAELEASIMKVAHLFGQPIAAAIAPPAPAPALLPAPAAAAPTARRGGRPRKVQTVTPRVAKAPGVRPIAGGELGIRVAAFLNKQKAPVTMAAVVGAVKSYPKAVRDVLDEFEARGTLIRTGTRHSLRLGRPEVMGQQPSGTKARDRATPPVRETAGPVRETPSAGGGTQAADRDSSGAEHHRLVGEIGRVLKSGISYDLREMKRNIAGAFPDAQVETIAKALEGLRIAGSVERIAMPSGGFRYRRRVQARDRHDQEAQRAEA